jgi:hypothetical protein
VIAFRGVTPDRERNLENNTSVLVNSRRAANPEFYIWDLPWTARVSGHDVSAQRPTRDRASTPIPDSPPRRAALCAESVVSRALPPMESRVAVTIGRPTTEHRRRSVRTATPRPVVILQRHLATPSCSQRHLATRPRAVSLLHRAPDLTSARDIGDWM